MREESGTLVSFDLNYRSGLWSKEAASDVFGQPDQPGGHVFAGDDEAAIAVGPAADALELARRVAALGPSQVIIKLELTVAPPSSTARSTTRQPFPSVCWTRWARGTLSSPVSAELLNGEPCGNVS